MNQFAVKQTYLTDVFLLSKKPETHEHAMNVIKTIDEKNISKAYFLINDNKRYREPLNEHFGMDSHEPNKRNVYHPDRPTIKDLTQIMNRYEGKIESVHIGLDVGQGIEYPWIEIDMDKQPFKAGSADRNSRIDIYQNAIKRGFKKSYHVMELFGYRTQENNNYEGLIQIMSDVLKTCTPKEEYIGNIRIQARPSKNLMSFNQDIHCMLGINNLIKELEKSTKEIR